MHHSRRIAAATTLVLSVGCLAACGGHSNSSSQPPPAGSAVAKSSGSHRAAKNTPTYPLTGRPATNPKDAKRPALSVKIDNISVALPQAGLNDADIVTEALVEGGLTRLFATFQSHSSKEIGPIRSARPVDADLLRELRGGIFAYSGADPREIAPVIARSNAALVSDDNRSQSFHRDLGRLAPDNLMSSSALLYKAGLSLKPHLPPPPHLFSYSAAPAKGARSVHHVSLSFSDAATAAWTYDKHQYDRTQGGAPDKLIGGQVVTASNVVILTTKYFLTHIIDDAGNADPYDLVTGSGRCWVLRDGTLTTGRWTRPSFKKQLRLRDKSGHTIDLQSGRTWIELLPPPQRPHFN